MQRSALVVTHIGNWILMAGGQSASEDCKMRNLGVESYRSKDEQWENNSNN